MKVTNKVYQGREPLSLSVEAETEPDNLTIRNQRAISRRRSAVVTRLKSLRHHAHAVPAAKIESAGALSGNLKARVRADLVQIYGPLKISFVEMPTLFGGMRITVGNDLYYGSVRGTLAVLEDKLRH